MPAEKPPIIVPRPSAAALKVLRDGLDAHIRNYVRDGGSRDFSLEDAQDAAKSWLDTVERAG